MHPLLVDCGRAGGPHPPARGGARAAPPPTSPARPGSLAECPRAPRRSHRGPRSPHRTPRTPAAASYGAHATAPTMAATALLSDACKAGYIPHSYTAVWQTKTQAGSRAHRYFESHRANSHPLQRDEDNRARGWLGALDPPQALQHCVHLQQARKTANGALSDASRHSRQHRAHPAGCALTISHKCRALCSCADMDLDLDD